jgi:hypothetical protein
MEFIMFISNQMSKNLIFRFLIIIVLGSGAIINLQSCGGNDKEEPKEFVTVSKVFIGQPDPALAAKGKALFQAKCTACHKYDERLVGPPLRTVATRRSPEYILSMITTPDQMIKNNDSAKVLLQKYMTQMTNQNVNIDDAKAIYEHLREISGSK